MQSWPDAVPFDPGIGAGSPVLEALVSGPAAALSAVLLVVGERAQKSGFGPAAAFAIADAWSAANRVPVLTDLGFENPSLHTLLDGSNDEGVADAFAFGTSLRMLWRPVEGRSFSFLAAGYAPDAAEVRASGDWRRIIAQESATGHTLLLYTPAASPGTDALAGKVGAVIVIAEPEDLPSAAESLPRPYAIVAILTPEVHQQSTVDTSTVGAPPERLASDEPAASEDTSPARTAPRLIVDDESEIDRAESGGSSLGPSMVTQQDFDRIRMPKEGAGREELMADLRARQRAALMAPPSDAEPTGGWPKSAAQAGTTIDGAERRGETVPAHHERGEGVERVRVAREETPTGTLPGEPPILRPGASPRGRRRKNPWLWPLLALAFVVVAFGAVWYVFGRGAARVPVPVRSSTAIPPVDSLAMVPLPYVVAIEAHTQLQMAEERFAALSASEKWTRFFVAPLVRDDIPYYHLFAGPLRDSAAAAAALDTLLAHHVKTGAVAADVRQVPLSFLVDRYPSQADALERVAELDKTGIPTFILSGDVNGVKQWRVYAGAYAGPAEADVMRALLKGAGVKDSLVTRTGRSNQ